MFAAMVQAVLCVPAVKSRQDGRGPDQNGRVHLARGQVGRECPRREKFFNFEGYVFASHAPAASRTVGHLRRSISATRLAPARVSEGGSAHPGPFPQIQSHRLRGRAPRTTLRLECAARHVKISSSTASQEPDAAPPNQFRLPSHFGYGQPEIFPQIRRDGHCATS